MVQVTRVFVTIRRDDSDSCAPARWAESKEGDAVRHGGPWKRRHITSWAAVDYLDHQAGQAQTDLLNLTRPELPLVQQVAPAQASL